MGGGAVEARLVAVDWRQIRSSSFFFFESRSAKEVQEVKISSKEILSYPTASTTTAASDRQVVCRQGLRCDPAGVCKVGGLDRTFAYLFCCWRARGVRRRGEPNDSTPPSPAATPFYSGTYYFV